MMIRRRILVAYPSISEGLNYITTELGSEAPNVLASGSIKEPEIKFSSEMLQYLYTGLTSEDGYPPRPCIEPSKGCAIEPASSSEFDIDSWVLINDRLDILRQSILWYPTQSLLGVFTTDMHLQPTQVEFYDSHGHHHKKSVPIPYP